jgi:hypothetical protein
MLHEIDQLNPSRLLMGGLQQQGGLPNRSLFYSLLPSKIAGYWWWN